MRSLNRYEIIDGNRNPKRGEGVAQMINDGKDAPHGNNCKYHARYDHMTASWKLYVKATRDITSGEELFVSYGKAYWTHGADWEICAPEDPGQPAASLLMTKGKRPRDAGKDTCTPMEPGPTKRLKPPPTPKRPREPGLESRSNKRSDCRRQMMAHDILRILKRISNFPAPLVTAYHSINHLLDPESELNSNGEGIWVLNTSPETHDGSHWVVLHRDASTSPASLTLYDPLTGPTAPTWRVLNHIQSVVGAPINTCYTGYQPDQDGWSCGHRCVAIAYTLATKLNLYLPNTCMPGLTRMVDEAITALQWVPDGHPHPEAVRALFRSLDKHHSVSLHAVQQGRGRSMQVGNTTVHTYAPANLPVKGDRRRAIALLGMIWEAPTNGSSTADSLRATELSEIACNMAVFTVDIGRPLTCPSDPLHIHGDFTNKKCGSPNRTHRNPRQSSAGMLT